MAELVTEYTDARFITHKVEHKTVADNDGKDREQLVEELVLALTGRNKPVTA